MCGLNLTGILVKSDWIKITDSVNGIRFVLVRVTGLEPAHLSALEPKSNVSASFTTPAHII